MKIFVIIIVLIAFYAFLFSLAKAASYRDVLDKKIEKELKENSQKEEA